MKLLFKLLSPWMLLALLGTLFACSTFQERPATSRLLITYATLKVIGTGDDMEARANKVARIADQGIEFLDTPEPSLDLLESQLRLRISELNLEPADAALAEALLQAVLEELRVHLPSGILSEQERMSVTAVLSSVKQAAGGGNALHF